MDTGVASGVEDSERFTTWTMTSVLRKGSTKTSVWPQVKLSLWWRSSDSRSSTNTQYAFVYFAIIWMSSSDFGKNYLCNGVWNWPLSIDRYLLKSSNPFMLPFIFIPYFSRCPGAKYNFPTVDLQATFTWIKIIILYLQKILTRNSQRRTVAISR